MQINCRNIFLTFGENQYITKIYNKISIRVLTILPIPIQVNTLLNVVH